MKRIVLTFGSIALAMLALLQMTRYSLVFPGFSTDLWIALLALLFGALGFILSRRITKPIVISTSAPAEIDETSIQQLGITNREYEVLELVAQGLSNQEIADRLFLSESTIKTHVSSLLTKLDAKRRTQAVTRAKALNIIA